MRPQPCAAAGHKLHTLKRVVPGRKFKPRDSQSEEHVAAWPAQLAHTCRRFRSVAQTSYAFSARPRVKPPNWADALLVLSEIVKWSELVLGISEPGEEFPSPDHTCYVFSKNVREP